MATRKKFKQTELERRRRTFSEEFKIAKVREIDQKITTIAEVCKQYEVSDLAVRNWRKKYSSNYMKGVRTIVELESDTRMILDLKAKVAQLEMLVGQKQIQLEFKDKVIEMAEETYKVDIKKKFTKKL